MVSTVNAAFHEFLKEYVNLDTKQTKSARKSRDWLLSQIRLFPTKDANFPKLYSEKDIFFGSFARRTKKRELDDIDIMIALSGEGGYYGEYSDRIEIYVQESIEPLNTLCNADSNILNSRKVINKFVDLLNQVPQYENAEIKRNLEAATLKLKSYSWNFDLVPCFFTALDWRGRDYYLIPDGDGNWQKTDPRIDRDRVTEINQIHDGNVLNIIRLMKYWNKRRTMPSMPSYLLENMILEYYLKHSYWKASNYVDLEVPKILSYISEKVFSPVDDPKQIQGNLNTLTFEEQCKISNRARTDRVKASEARALEESKDHKASTVKWHEIFGSNFPICD